MDCIPKDIEGYELVECQSDDPDIITRLKEPQTIEAETTRGKEEITISQEGYALEPYSIITTPDETIVVNDEYLTEHVVEYALVRMMWRLYNDVDHSHELYNIVCIFDDKIFIVVLGHDTSDFIGTPPGEVPATLFIYDVEASKFLYAGYREELDRIDTEYIKIVKTDNTLE